MTRKEAIERIKIHMLIHRMAEDRAVYITEALNMAIEALEAQRWIPCKIKLPDDLEEVNVTWINHDPEPYYNFIKDKPFTATAVYYKERWYWYSSTCADMLAEYGHNEVDEVDKDIEIVAWQKMPEPYKEDNDG